MTGFLKRFWRSVTRRFGRRHSWPVIPFDEIRRRTRILVIDDQEFPYEELFRRDGYTIEKWEDVRHLNQLEQGHFDLILLDLQGVGRAESADQGVGVLRHLREVSPAQIIVAYSNADWGLSYQDFFRLADTTLPKSADYVKFKENVDSLLKKRFSLGFYLSRIVAEAPAQEIDSRDLEEAAKDAILSQDLQRLREYLEEHVSNPRTIDRLLSIAQVATGVLQLWKT